MNESDSLRNELKSQDFASPRISSEMTPESYGRFIASKREALGLSQAKLALLLDKHVTYISKIERGQYVPNPKVASQLANILQENPRSFVQLTMEVKTSVSPNLIHAPSNYSTPQRELSAKEALLLKKFRALSPDGQEYVEKSLQLVLVTEKGMEAAQNFSTPQTEESTAKLKLAENKNTPGSKVDADPLTSSAEIQGASTQLEPLPPKPKKSSKKIEIAQKTFNEGDKNGGITQMIKIASDPLESEDSVRSICEFLLENKELKVAEQLLGTRTKRMVSTDILLGKIYAAQGNLEAALDLYKQRALSETDPETKFRFAISSARRCIEVKNLDRARSFINSAEIPLKIADKRLKSIAIRTAIDLDLFQIANELISKLGSSPKDQAYALSLKGLIQLKQKQFKELIVTATLLLSSDHESSTGKYFLALANYFLRDPISLTDVLEKSIGIDWPYAPIFSEMCGFALTKGTAPKKIIPFLTQYKETGDELLFETLAQAYFFDDQDEEAISIARAGFKKFPTSHKLANSIAWMHLSRDEYELADHILEVELPNCSEDPNCAYILARSKFSQGKYSETENLLTTALKKSPESVRVRSLLVDALLKRRAFQEAKTLCEEYLATSPDDQTMLSSLGETYSDEGSHKKAVEIFERLVGESPKNLWYWTNLAYSCIRIGQYDRGEEAFKTCTELHPNSWATWNNYGYAQNMNGHYAEATNTLQKALTFDTSPENQGITHSNLAHSYVKQGRIEDALAATRKSIDLNREWAEAHYNYGLVLLAINDKEKAKIEFHEAIRLDKLDSCTKPALQKIQMISSQDK